MPKIADLKELWKWVTQITDWDSLEGKLVSAAIALAAIWISIKLLMAILELLLKFRETWKELGFAVTLSTEQKLAIKRRQGFCGVLRSDIASLNKVESWNDQFFTELEAEVEAEGSYYASRVDRLLRRKSSGLRRVKSLTKAILSSTEPAALIVGDPGSGKSVALRHLALDLAERGQKSSSPKAPVPLYINLKELPNAPPEGPTADFIKSFVIDNVRRGDADTADFLRENWQTYKDEGIWFFIFDSFDEIPEVLHAPSGSDTIQRYGEAIRQFLDGMSACRGCLASREFKGPETLPWWKFRIMPLTAERQEKLISNAMLSRKQEKTVQTHLTVTQSRIYLNPLFLTLLCKHVKREQGPPAHDFNLVIDHIGQLARRDQEYIGQHYRLTPGELLEGARKIAVLLAEDSGLSLAPTLDEIEAAARKQGRPLRKADALLGALVETKIGRSDVREAKRGDRRFTFAHRRYQESLYVESLAATPEHLPARKLLSDSEWREYAVTLLQTQSPEVVEPILETAIELIRENGKDSRTIPVVEELGGELSYYDWEGEKNLDLLGLLQEGLATRLDLVSENLRAAVGSYLLPRWESGDALDRINTIFIGGLLPQQRIAEILEESIEFGSSAIHSKAFKLIPLLTTSSNSIKDFTKNQIRRRAMGAHGRTLDHLETLARRLPENFYALDSFRKGRRQIHLIRTFLILFLVTGMYGVATSTLFKTGPVLLFVASALFLFTGTIALAGWQHRGNNHLLIFAVVFYPWIGLMLVVAVASGTRSLIFQATLFLPLLIFFVLWPKREWLARSQLSRLKRRGVTGLRLALQARFLPETLFPDALLPFSPDLRDWYRGLISLKYAEYRSLSRSLLSPGELPHLKTYPLFSSLDSRAQKQAAYRLGETALSLTDKEDRGVDRAA